jgi:hypothetical protein
MQAAAGVATLGGRSSRRRNPESHPRTEEDLRFLVAGDVEGGRELG